jgi:uncharacterized lipoprotein YddW (UPF0748 family)
VRALWVDAFHDGFKTPSQVDLLIADALRAGVNTLAVQVRRRGDAYYTRTDEPRTEDATLAPGFDALQAIIDRAHAARPRLEVHAWIATLPVWNKEDQPPEDPRHVFNRHGPAATGTDSWIALSSTGDAWDGQNYSLDPGHPDAAAYVAGVTGDLVRRYALDGLHLDLVRYAGAKWGYNAVSLDRYRRRSGTASLPAPADPGWQQWRRDQVTGLVRRISQDTTTVRPGVKVSAAVICWGAGPRDERTWRMGAAFRTVLQDWMGWLDEGIVDAVLPMIYDDDGDPDQRAWFDQWISWLKGRKKKGQVVAGVAMYLNDPAGGLSQIRRALEPAPAGGRLDGVALYSYAVSNAPPPGSASEVPATPNGDLFRALVAPSPWSGDAPPPFAVPAGPPAK